MKTLKQLIRQPLKTLFGLLLIALASAILCTSVGQAVAAEEQRKSMEYTFVTTALPTTKHQMKTVTEWGADGEPYSYETFNHTVREDVDQWILSTVEEHPELVKCLSSPGLASAYLEGFTADNPTQYMLNWLHGGSCSHGMILSPMFQDSPLSSVMLEISLDHLAEPRVTRVNVQQPDGSTREEIFEVMVCMTGTILSTVGLQEGYKDPVGYTAQIGLYLPDLETLERLNLTVGQRYLVYGRDYYDNDWFARNFISDECNHDILIEELNPDDLHLYVGAPDLIELDPFNYNYSGDLIGYYLYNEIRYDVFELHADFMWSIQMTARDQSVMPGYTHVEQPGGGYSVREDNLFALDEEGKPYPLSQEEYTKRYGTPTVAHLTGTAEEFLASEEGALWRETLDEVLLNHQTFAFIGVDRMGYLGSFANEQAAISQGRDFTLEELETGAKVCIMSEHVAQLNGLKVGDTISPRFYNYDRADPVQDFLDSSYGVVNPVPVYHSKTTPWAGEPETYTIVGLYRQKTLWENVFDNIYSFTPNTFFVPKKSVTSEMDFSNQGVFRTLVLPNGGVPAFQELVYEAGYDGLFEYHDHGYSLVADSLQDYQAVARQAMEIGCIIYSAILLLFLLLFPGMQKKNVMIMDSLGADRKQKIRHVMGSSLGVLVPGTLLGVGTGALLWQTVTEKLSSETMELTIPVPTLLLTAAAQLLAAAALVFLIALPITKSRGLARRK